ncbi:MAG: hypothetical protein CVT59_06690 [Actinobacteria bacterium HGW-Actinobacteria-1]|jgi:hypothetical protein|nr:MAG: hypothetical protein CVT59_06690 [Actinobacteria bacterium HGW-Actinobacteria-1]
MTILRPGPDCYEDLFAAKVFAVPSYQRDYAWDEDLCVRYLKDLVSTALAVKAGAADVKRYIGAVVMVEYQPALSDMDLTSFASEDARVFHVIDGQQRLATTLLLLAALRDVVNSSSFEADGSDKANFQQQVNNMIYGGVGPDDKPRSRLCMSRKDKEFFDDLLINPALRSVRPYRPLSNRKLWMAYRAFLDKLTEHCIECAGDGKAFATQIDFMRQLRNSLLRDFQVIRIEVDSISSAFDVFESLNAKRMDLTESELVKNLLLCRVSRDGGSIREASDKWDTITARVSEEMVQFLRHRMCAKHKRVVQKKEIYALLETELNAGYAGLFSALDADSKCYAELTVSCQPGEYVVLGTRATKSLRELRDSLGQVQARILLLSAVRAVRDERMSKDQFTSLVERLVTLFVRYRILGMNPNTLSSDWAEYANRLEPSSTDPISPDTLVELVRGKTPSDEKLRLAFSEWRVDGAATKFATYLLFELEHRMNPSNPRRLDPTDLTLEHVIPQDVNQTEWFGSDVYEPSDLTDILTRPGNLALLYRPENASAGNRDYSTKLKVYRRPNMSDYLPEDARGRTSVATFELIREIVDSYPTEFLEKEVDSRTAVLADRVASVWSV